MTPKVLQDGLFPWRSVHRCLTPMGGHSCEVLGWGWLELVSKTLSVFMKEEGWAGQGRERGQGLSDPKSRPLNPVVQASCRLLLTVISTGAGELPATLAEPKLIPEEPGGMWLSSLPQHACCPHQGLPRALSRSPPSTGTKVGRVRAAESGTPAPEL